MELLGLESSEDEDSEEFDDDWRPTLGSRAGAPVRAHPARRVRPEDLNRRIRAVRRWAHWVDAAFSAGWSTAEVLASQTGGKGAAAPRPKGKGKGKSGFSAYPPGGWAAHSL